MAGALYDLEPVLGLARKLSYSGAVQIQNNGVISADDEKRGRTNIP